MKEFLFLCDVAGWTLAVEFHSLKSSLFWELSIVRRKKEKGHSGGGPQSQCWDKRSRPRCSATHLDSPRGCGDYRPQVMSHLWCICSSCTVHLCAQVAMQRSSKMCTKKSKFAIPPEYWIFHWLSRVKVCVYFPYGFMSVFQHMANSWWPYLLGNQLIAIFWLLPDHPFWNSSCDKGLGWEYYLAAMEKSTLSGSLGKLQAVLLIINTHLREHNHKIPWGISGLLHPDFES